MIHTSITPASEYRDKKFYLSNDNSKMIKEVIEVLRYYSKKFNSYKNIKCLAVYTSKIPEWSFYYCKNAELYSFYFDTDGKIREYKLRIFIEDNNRYWYKDIHQSLIVKNPNWEVSISKAKTKIY